MRSRPPEIDAAQWQEVDCHFFSIIKKQYPVFIHEFSHLPLPFFVIPFTFPPYYYYYYHLILQIMNEIDSMDNASELYPVTLSGFSDLKERANAHTEWLDDEERVHIGDAVTAKTSAEQTLEFDYLKRIRKIHEKHASQSQRLLRVSSESDCE